MIELEQGVQERAQNAPLWGPSFEDQRSGDVVPREKTDFQDVSWSDKLPPQPRKEAAVDRDTAHAKKTGLLPKQADIDGNCSIMLIIFFFRRGVSNIYSSAKIDQKV